MRASGDAIRRVMSGVKAMLNLRQLWELDKAIDAAIAYRKVYGGQFASEYDSAIADLKACKRATRKAINSLHS